MTPAELSNYIDQNLPSGTNLKMNALREVLKFLFINGIPVPITLFGMQVSKYPLNEDPDILEPGDIVRGYWDKNTFWPNSVYLGPDASVKENYFIPNEIYIPDDLEELRGMSVI